MRIGVRDSQGVRFAKRLCDLPQAFHPQVPDRTRTVQRQQYAGIRVQNRRYIYCYTNPPHAKGSDRRLCVLIESYDFYLHKHLDLFYCDIDVLHDVALLILFIGTGIRACTCRHYLSSLVSSNVS